MPTDNFNESGASQFHSDIIEAHDLLNEAGFNEVADDCWEYNFPGKDRQIYVIYDNGVFNVYFETRDTEVKHTPAQLIKGIEAFMGP
jgi:hypothetical protein